MIKVGDKVPDFKAQAYHNDKIVEVDSKTLDGKWWILFFYPGDFTFVCPTELKDLASKYDEFKKLGVQVMSVSTDSVHVHKAWHDASDTIKQIQFPMIADPTNKITKDYGVYLEDEGESLRGTFLVNPDGELVAMEVHEDGIGRSADELLRRVQAAKHVRENGVVCPANWRPGDKDLKPGLDLVGKI